MPPLRWWDGEQNTARLFDSDAKACSTANEVLAALGAPPLVSLADLRSCEATVLCTFAELDHYPQRPGEAYLGPVFSLGQGVPAVWPEGDGPRVFAYLKPTAELEATLAALRASKARVLAHVPGAARRTLANHTTPQMVFSEPAVDMNQARAGSDLAVCHGGGGTTAAMLLAGKPLLVLPMHMEQVMTARRLQAIGAGVAVTTDRLGQLPRALAKALGDEGLKAAAQAFAAAHAGYEQADTVRTSPMIDAVLTMEPPPAARQQLTAGSPRRVSSVGSPVAVPSHPSIR